MGVHPPVPAPGTFARRPGRFVSVNHPRRWPAHPSQGPTRTWRVAAVWATKRPRTPRHGAVALILDGSVGKGKGPALQGPLGGGETGTRTRDTTIFSRVLYQLSYLAEAGQGTGWPAGLAAGRVGVGEAGVQVGRPAAPSRAANVPVRLPRARAGMPPCRPGARDTRAGRTIRRRGWAAWTGTAAGRRPGRGSRPMGSGASRSAGAARSRRRCCRRWRRAGRASPAGRP